MPRGTASSLTPDFLEEAVDIRGVQFKLRELSIGEYDDLVKKATTTKVNQLTGEESEMIDNTLLLKLMVLKCVVQPKLSPEAHSNLPMRASLKLNQTVNRMHYGDEPAVAGKQQDDDNEGNDQGND